MTEELRTLAEIDAELARNTDGGDVDPSLVEENPIPPDWYLDGERTFEELVDELAATPTTETSTPQQEEVTSSRRTLATRRLADVEMRSIVYLDRPLFQRAAFHLLAGKKGCGKGTYTALLAARVTRGELYGVPKNVLIAASEDSDAIDIRPRVRAAGGDDSRVFTIQESLLLPRDADRLLDTAREIGDVGLVAFDPVASYVRGDTHHDAPVREALDPLNGIADELDCLLLGIRHLSEKETSKGALAAVLGASAWVQIPRVVLVVAADDEDERTFHIAVAAGNRSARGAGRVFRIELADLDGLTEPVTRALEAGVSTKSVDELLGRSADDRRQAVKRDGCREIILRELERSPSTMVALKARCAAEIGAGGDTVWKAANELKADGDVYCQNSGPGTGWVWYLTSVRSQDFGTNSELRYEVNGDSGDQPDFRSSRGTTTSQEVTDYVPKTGPDFLTSDFGITPHADTEVNEVDE